MPLLCTPTFHDSQIQILKYGVSKGSIIHPGGKQASTLSSNKRVNMLRPGKNTLSACCSTPLTNTTQKLTHTDGCPIYVQFGTDPFPFAAIHSLPPLHHLSLSPLPHRNDAPPHSLASTSSTSPPPYPFAEMAGSGVPPFGWVAWLPFWCAPAASTAGSPVTTTARLPGPQATCERWGEGVGG